MGSQMHSLEGSQIRNFDQLNQFISELSVHAVCDILKTEQVWFQFCSVVAQNVPFKGTGTKR